MLHLDYRDSRPIYAQIVDGLKEQITAGVFNPGEKLPSVRELAAILTINPNTIQRAYAALENEGYIASVTGKGSFVCHREEAVTPEQGALLRILSETVEKLISAGMCREAILDYLKKEEEIC